MTTENPPDLSYILETVLYSRNDTRDAMAQFYDELLGLGERRTSAGGYRLGSSMLLIFNADESTGQSRPPPHGTVGPAHTCFVSPPGAYENWKRWILGAGVDIIDEIEWTSPLRGRSIYFRDPSGNVLEIADTDIWPQESARNDSPHDR